MKVRSIRVLTHLTHGGFPDGGSGGKKKKKNMSANAGDIERQVQSLGREDALEKEMAIHSKIFAWRIPWTDEPDWLQPIGLQRVRKD